MTLSKIEQAEREMWRCHCRPNEKVVRITTEADDGEASAWVCGLRFHHDAAVAWVEAISGKPAVVLTKAESIAKSAARSGRPS